MGMRVRDEAGNVVTSASGLGIAARRVEQEGTVFLRGRKDGDRGTLLIGGTAMTPEQESIMCWGAVHCRVGHAREGLISCRVARGEVVAVNASEFVDRQWIGSENAPVFTNTSVLTCATGDKFKPGISFGGSLLGKFDDTVQNFPVTQGAALEV